MRRFVGDDVMTETGEDYGVGHLYGDLRRLRRKISEEQCLLLRAVIGVRIPEGMWIDTKTPDEVIMGDALSLLLIYPDMRRPHDGSAKRHFEIFDRRHRHRIHHLLMELRITLAGRRFILSKDIGVVEIYRCIKF